MKRTFLDILLLLLAGLLVTGCSTDSENDGTQPTADGLAQVRLRLTVAGSPVTRAWSDDGATRAWSDANAVDAEMMNLWVVVVTDASDVVEKVVACRPTGTSREVDPITTLPLGEHHFYSFANMSVDTVATLLDITVTMPEMTADDVAYESTAASGTVNADKAVTVCGNGFAALTSTADNGFGSYGIPMSNRQTATISGSTTLDLVVVRLLAKMQVSVTNATGSAVTIRYATISNVTDNTADNLKLLPTWTTTTGQDRMDVVQHGDLQPHLNGTPATTELAIPDMASATALADGEQRQVTFYVNECRTGTDFMLTIGLGDGSATNEYRYALIDSRGATTADDNCWDYIARNDYRIIPVVLDDYHFQLVPYDFPPIGVYPVSVSEVDDVNHVYNFTFHDYGHFHLLPQVTKGSTTQVKYNVGTGDYWTLKGDWDQSWRTAAAKGGAWLDADGIAANTFYRSDSGSTTHDGDDEGRAPVWYANDGATVGGIACPQWDPALGLGQPSNYQPFVFGYIADPGAALAADKSIYHEMTVRLFVDGTYRRDMTYRFYMTLSADQMLYGARRTAARRHGHTTKN